MLSLKGTMVALVTPMCHSGAIDLEALDRLIDFHLTQNTDGLVILGTTGEAATINIVERELIIKHVVSRVAGRIPIIAGTGSNNTAETIERTREAQWLGADAALIVTPYYNKPTQHGLFLHYKSIADAVSLPQIIYNVPSRTGVDLANETVASLAQLENVVGIKDATGDLSRVELLAQTSLRLLSGDDISASRFVLSGGHGVISVVANVAPQRFHALMQASIQRDTIAAELDSALSPLYDSLFWETNPIPVKWVLSRMGLIDNVLRLPLTTLSDHFKDRMNQVLSQLEIPLLNFME